MTDMGLIKNVFDVDSDVVETKKAFLEHLTEEDPRDCSKWFGEFLYTLKEEWIDKKVSITEILIREDQHILLAAIKAYILYTNEKGDPVYVDKNLLLSVVNKFAKRMSTTTDFSFMVFGLGVFRCAFSNDEGGYGISIRYQPFNIPDLEDIKFPSFYKDFLASMIKKVVLKNPVTKVEHDARIVKGGGLILHVGPTSSGKSTCIAAEVSFFAENTNGAILTLETPIEYRFGRTTKAPIRQYEIGRDIIIEQGQKLEDVIVNHILRNNPSLIHWGECRTHGEMRMVVDLSNRGHLVETTAHAGTVIEGLNLFAHALGDAKNILSQSLVAVVAHQLMLNKNGEIVPVYEILIPDTLTRESIRSGKIHEISRRFYQDRVLELGITFKDCLDDYVATGHISAVDKEMFLSDHPHILPPKNS